MCHEMTRTPVQNGTRNDIHVETGLLEMDHVNHPLLLRLAGTYCVLQ